MKLDQGQVEQYNSQVSKSHFFLKIEANKTSYTPENLQALQIREFNSISSYLANERVVHNPSDFVPKANMSATDLHDCSMYSDNFIANVRDMNLPLINSENLRQTYVRERVAQQYLDGNRFNGNTLNENLSHTIDMASHINTTNFNQAILKFANSIPYGSVDVFGHIAMYSDVSSDLVFIALGDKVGCALGYRMFLTVFGMLKQDKNVQVFFFRALWEIQRRGGGLTNAARVSVRTIMPSLGGVLGRIVYPDWQPRIMPMTFTQAFGLIGNTVHLVGGLYALYNFSKTHDLKAFFAALQTFLGL